MASKAQEMMFVLNGRLASAFRSATGEAEKRIDGLTGRLKRFENVQKTGGGIMGSFAGKIGALAGAYISLQSAQAIIGDAAQYEQSQVAFETMLRSADKANKMLKDLSDFAAKTPYEFPEIQASAKALLAFGFDSEKVKGKLETLGNIASGLGIPLNELATIYGKARVQGRLYQGDINELTNRGIPIIQSLSKQFGVAETKVRDLVTKGKIGFKEVDKALTDLATGNGRFAGGMEKQSKTLIGMWSTLKDNVRAAFRDEAMEAMPSIKALLQLGIDKAPALSKALEKAAGGIVTIGKYGKTAFDWLQKSGTIDKVASGLAAIGQYGKTAFNWIQTSGILKFAPLIEGIAGGLMVYSGVLKVVATYNSIAAAATWALNAAQMASPWMWVAAGIGLVVGAVYMLIKNWDTVKAGLVAAWQWFVKFGTEGPGRFIPIVGMIAQIAKHWDLVKAGFAAGWQWIQKFFTEGPGRFTPIIGSIIQIVKHWDQVKAGLAAGWQWIQKFFTEGPGRFTPIIGSIIQIAKNWDKIKATGIAAWNAIKNAMAPVWDFILKIVSKVQAAINKINELRNKIPGAKALGPFGYAFSAGNAIGKKIAGHAQGGIVQHQTLSWLAEKGPEAVIPLNNDRNRAKSLWTQTGRQLGMAGAGGGSMEVNVTIPITVNGSATKADLQSVFGNAKDEFRRLLNQVMDEERRRSMRGY